MVVKINPVYLSVTKLGSSCLLLEKLMYFNSETTSMPLTYLVKFLFVANRHFCFKERR